MRLVLYILNYHKKTLQKLFNLFLLIFEKQNWLQKPHGFTWKQMRFYQDEIWQSCFYMQLNRAFNV